MQGIETLYQHVQRAVDFNLEQWEHNALKKIFALPPGLLLPPSQVRCWNQFMITSKRSESDCQIADVICWTSRRRLCKAPAKEMLGIKVQGWAIKVKCHRRFVTDCVRSC
jgi:hypothetical protein